MKKMTSLILSLIMLLSVSMNVFATSDDELFENVIEIDATEYPEVTEEEWYNLSDNIDAALSNINNGRARTVHEDGSIVIPVSENLILRITEEDIVDEGLYSSKSMMRTKSRTSTLELENRLGKVIIELRSTAKFEYGNSNVKVIDTFGGYDAFGWTIDVSSASGNERYNSWGRNTFKGELKIGIDPVSLTFQSFSYSNTLECAPAGIIISEWK